MTVVEQLEITEEIKRLKAEKNAVILAHNYQLPEVQDCADFVGDSLGLSQAAAKTDADIIVFCGVHFMAETASIICPEKKVLLPDLEAGCSLAATINAEQLRQWKAQHPNAVVVAYVNTTAEVKAEADYCCTSTNAVKVVQAIPPDKEILFLPDMFLGAYIERVTGRKMHIWMGECHVHAGIRPQDVEAARAAHPDAELLVHPECGCSTSCMYLQAAGALKDFKTKIFSTEGMIRYAKESPSREFIVATEVGILHRMKKEAPGKRFYPANPNAICEYMKKITLEKVLRSLREEIYEIRVPEPTASRARRAIERMLAIV
ncbi:MAG: quinolinate synthase NadA [Candidatus Bipolaricaulota bacterium]|nr:quinolinate synthase NadA [Candidatus Bipolaricaulota bacterium]MCS7274104.1 quinolinate synthase NadA [Candidatus Bipolaricaulota bacterium]MDW8111277.1 quinolinate synthase NadA [Candidatus Bipolaricaulota bacterium]MDW8328587.1 quinolinate synthase NadA [Candidatus Bipolaricaulota bacterium]